MEGYNIFIGAVLLAAGLIVSGTGALTVASTPFTDTYPTEDDWFNDGNLDNLIDDEGTLHIDMDSESDNGTFTSNIFEREEKISLDRIEYDALNIAENQGRLINVTLEARTDGAIEETETIQIRESGVRTEEVFNGEMYDSYSFTVEMETDSSSSPELDSLEIIGDTEEGGNLMTQAISFLLMGIGLLMMVKSF